jgi:hypothetical protein
MRSFAETYVVVRSVPFHCTLDPEVKPDPNTVILNAGPAAATEVGDTELTLAVQPAMIPSRQITGTQESGGASRNGHLPSFAVRTSRARISIPYVLLVSDAGNAALIASGKA